MGGKLSREKKRRGRQNEEKGRDRSVETEKIQKRSAEIIK